MAKNTVTRVSALTAAIAKFDADAPEREVLEKMLASISKPRAKSSAPSKTAMENAALAREVLAVMPEGEAVTGRWITEHVRGILTPQKCTAVMTILVNANRVSKVKAGKVMTYTRL